VDSRFRAMHSARVLANLGHPMVHSLHWSGQTAPPGGMINCHHGLQCVATSCVGRIAASFLAAGTQPSRELVVCVCHPCDSGKH
jgi:hypothetical protein